VLLAECARVQAKPDAEVAKAAANWLISDLFGGLNLLWDKLRPVLAGMRQEIDPYLYENFELLCRQAQDWKAEHPPRGS